jgi:hypothetical protein
MKSFQIRHESHTPNTRHTLTPCCTEIIHETRWKIHIKNFGKIGRITLKLSTTKRDTSSKK